MMLSHTVLIETCRRSPTIPKLPQVGTTNRHQPGRVLGIVGPAAGVAVDGGPEAAQNARYAIANARVHFRVCFVHLVAAFQIAHAAPVLKRLRLYSGLQRSIVLSGTNAMA
jgi:hypothetical protein